MSNSYTITTTPENVKLVFGSIPVSDMYAIIASCPKGSVASITAAKMADATFAFGLDADCQKFQVRIYPNRLIATKNLYPNLSSQAQEWIASFKGGSSSFALFFKATGISLSNCALDSYPHDASDFKRCRILIESVPEIYGILFKMTSVSKVWANFVKHWIGICNCMDSEVPNWRFRSDDAPNTNKMIQNIISN